MQLPQTVELKGIRVLTTRQLAEAYGTGIKIIQNNFQRNKDRYVAGKHYIYMDRDELREVKTTHPQFDGELKRASRMHFWTEKGALLHAKSLNTDKAWEVYEYLVDFYFRAKESVKTKTQDVRKMPVKQVVDVPDNPKILAAIQKVQDDLTCMNVLVENLKRYLSKEEYLERRKSAADVVHFLIRDWNGMLSLEPNMVEKLY